MTAPLCKESYQKRIRRGIRRNIQGIRPTGSSCGLRVVPGLRGDHDGHRGRGTAVGGVDGAGGILGVFRHCGECEGEKGDGEEGGGPVGVTPKESRQFSHRARQGFRMGIINPYSEGPLRGRLHQDGVRIFDADRPDDNDVRHRHIHLLATKPMPAATH